MKRKPTNKNKGQTILGLFTDYGPITAMEPTMRIVMQAANTRTSPPSSNRMGKLIYCHTWVHTGRITRETMRVFGSMSGTNTELVLAHLNQVATPNTKDKKMW